MVDESVSLKIPRLPSLNSSRMTGTVLALGGTGLLCGWAPIMFGSIGFLEKLLMVSIGVALYCIMAVLVSCDFLRYIWRIYTQPKTLLIEPGKFTFDHCRRRAQIVNMDSVRAVQIGRGEGCIPEMLKSLVFLDGSKKDILLRYDVNVESRLLSLLQSGNVVIEDVSNEGAQLKVVVRGSGAMVEESVSLKGPSLPVEGLSILIGTVLAIGGTGLLCLWCLLGAGADAPIFGSIGFMAHALTVMCGVVLYNIMAWVVICRLLGYLWHINTLPKTLLIEPGKITLDNGTRRAQIVNMDSVRAVQIGRGEGGIQGLMRSFVFLDGGKKDILFRYNVNAEPRILSLLQRGNVIIEDASKEIFSLRAVVRAFLLGVGAATFMLFAEYLAVGYLFLVWEK